MDKDKGNLSGEFSCSESSKFDKWRFIFKGYQIRGSYVYIERFIGRVLYHTCFILHVSRMINAVEIYCSKNGHETLCTDNTITAVNF